MTKYGYADIIKKIKDRLIYPPADLGLKELTSWLNGYSTCQNDIIELIEKIEEEESKLRG